MVILTIPYYSFSPKGSQLRKDFYFWTWT